MTYTEFIKGIENNIAKANCNKFNIGEYEEKQKQIYKQIRADANDEFATKICEILEKYQTGFNMVSMANIWLFSRELAEELKAGGENEN